MTGDAWAALDPTACDLCGRDACEGHVPDDDAAAGPPLVAFSLDGLRQHVFPTRRTVLLRGDTPVLRAGQLAEVFAERGIGKTWFLSSLALAAASGREVLGFRAPTVTRTLYLDGEMASQDLQTRFDLLADRLHVGVGSRLTILAADWQPEYLARLDTPAGQAAVQPFVDAAELIVLDNRSCLFDPDGEKDATKWQPAQDWLLSLRRRGKAVLMAHHANRQGGARGHSKPEDALDVLIKLARPDDYVADQGVRFVASFEKTRGIYGAAAAPFAARLTPEGWQTDGTAHRPTVADKLLAYVRLTADAGEPVRSANAAIAGAHVGRNEALAAWAVLRQTAAITKGPDGGYRVA